MASDKIQNGRWTQNFCDGGEVEMVIGILFAKGMHGMRGKPVHGCFWYLGHMVRDIRKIALFMD